MEKTFLFCLGDHKRPITIASRDIDVEKAVRETFHDLLESDCKIFLQLRDEGWKEYVDLTGSVADIPNNSVLRVIVTEKKASLDVFHSAAKLSSKLAKPCAGEAKELGKLFPHSIRKQFDPNAELGGIPSKKKKRASTSLGRSINVTVCRLPVISKAIPRGKARKLLKDDGRIVQVKLTRSMTPDMIRAMINRAFPRFSDIWDYVEASSDNSLSTACELPDGQTLCAKRGCVYIVDKPAEVGDGGASFEQKDKPDPSPMQAVSSANAVEYMQQEVGTSSEFLESIDIEMSDNESLPEVVFTSISKESEERQSLVLEQNKAYEESLHFDQAKDIKKSEEARRRQLREELKHMLRAKCTSSSVAGDSLTVRFRLPNGHRLEHEFTTECYVEDLYAYVFSTELVDDNFSLVVLHPKKDLVPSSLVSGKIGMVVVEERNDSPNVFELLWAKHNPCSQEDTVCTESSEDVTIEEAKKERELFMSNTDMKMGVFHNIDRSNIYDDVVNLYSKNNGTVVNECPFHVQFCNEKAVDIGGVTRDMFSAFFDELYVRMFDGSTTLYPAVHASVDLTAFRVIGRVFSHAYLISGVFPDRIAFPCLAAVFLGPGVTIPDTVLHTCFLSSLCTHDASVMQEAFKLGDSVYPQDIQDGLITIFSSKGCREIPSAKNLKRLIIQSARYTFLVKPAAALNMLNDGIPQQHIAFWRNISVQKLKSLYDVLSVSHSKVLKLLEEPPFCSTSEEDVWLYLRQFIGNMTQDELRAFLRFVTGSFVICLPRISVMFNKLEGLARRPISHTCSGMLELSSNYSSLPEFVSEFRAVLADPCYSWQMDSL